MKTLAYTVQLCMNVAGSHKDTVAKKSASKETKDANDSSSDYEEVRGEKDPNLKAMTLPANLRSGMSICVYVCDTIQCENYYKQIASTKQQSTVFAAPEKHGLLWCLKRLAQHEIFTQRLINLSDSLPFYLFIYLFIHSFIHLFILCQAARPVKTLKHKT